MAKARGAPKQAYSFTLILSGVDSIDDLESGVYGAGCHDALVGMRCGTPYVAFDQRPLPCTLPLCRRCGTSESWGKTFALLVSSQTTS